ncbi:MAG: hypothetical protein JNL77_07830 [Nitrosomonas sp.]|nr:hypothetical protein [Nitrosomonas sp.]
MHINDNLNAILCGLRKVKKTGEGRYVAQCLFHEDKTPSAALTQKPDGTILVHCFSCGASGLDFCNTLGIDPSTLFPPTNDLRYEKKKRSGFSAWQLLYALHADLIRLLIIVNDLQKVGALSGDDREFVAEIILRLNDGISYMEGAR